MNDDLSNSLGNLSFGLLSVFFLEHISLIQIESFVKIACQICVALCTIYVMLWKTNKDKDSEN